MNLIDELRQYDVDIEDALVRFGSDIDFYEFMARKFPSALEPLKVMPCFEAGDIDAAVSNAHQLKSMTGNLGFTTLFKGYSEIVSLLRAGKIEEGRKVLTEILPTEYSIISCIQKYV